MKDSAASARLLDWGDADILLRFRAERSDDARALFGPTPRSIEELAEVLRARPIDAENRRRVISTLRPRWEGLSLPEAARTSIERLEDPTTHIAIAGQQPAQWGGPLMLAVKALAVCRVAEDLTAAGVPTVPVFWIASEDHDVGELRAGRVVPSSGPTVDLVPPFDAGRRMLGQLEYDAPAATRLSAIAPLLGADDPTAWVELLAGTLTDRPAEEFQNLWVALFGSRGLLPVRPEWLRERQQPIVAAELARPGALADQIRPVIERLEGFGLPVPIPRPSAYPFFWVGDDGARHRLVPDGDHVRIGSESAEPRTVAQLEEELAANPDRVSPDALLRPIVQDTLLEPGVTLLGPTEFAYHLELTEAYRARGVERPVLLPRPRVRILSPEDDGALADLELDPAQLRPGTSPVDEIPSLAATQKALELQKRSDALIELIRGWAEDASLDHALRKRTDRLSRRLRDDMRKLEASLQRGAAPDVEGDRERLGAILERLFPGGEEGERVGALLGFLIRYGTAGLESLEAHLDLDDGRMKLIVLAAEGAADVG